MINNVLIIAEVKTKSPFGYASDENWEELFRIAVKIGDWISIHTDPKWGGSFELLKKAKRLTAKPILAKGIHSSDEEIIKAIESGADYVLVVGRIPKLSQIYLDKCLIEPLTISELSEIPANFKVVWNSRDLSDGKIKKESFEQARKIWKGWLCQASNIRNVRNIKQGADAVLVGANLSEFCESTKR